MPAAKQDQVAFDEWKERDELALIQITLTLEDEPLDGVIHIETALGVWDKLMRTYEGKGKQTMASLISELFRGTLSDDSPLQPQLDAMLHKKHLLSGLGVSLDDSLIAIAMVLSLPPSYSTLSTILMSSQETLTTDIVTSQVLEHEKSLQNSQKLSALVTRTSKQNGSQTNTNRKETKKRNGKNSNSSSFPNGKQCAHCGRMGHVKDKC